MADGDEEAAAGATEEAPATEATEAAEGGGGGGEEAASKSSKTGKKKKKTKDKTDKDSATKEKKKKKGGKKKKKSSGEEGAEGEAAEGGDVAEGEAGAEEKKKKGKKKKKGEKKEGDKKEKGKKKKKSKPASEGGDTSGAGASGGDVAPEASAAGSEEPKVSASASDDGATSGDGESENSEEQKMMDLLQQWDEDDETSSEEEEESSEEEEEEELDIPLYTSDDEIEDNMIDHIILASPNIEEGMDAFEVMSGIKPKICGGLAGLGVIAARVALDSRAYIEIIGPDPKRSGPLGAKLIDLEEGTLAPFHYAVRLSDLSELRDEYIPNELGFEPDHLNMVGKDRDDEPANWEIMFMLGHFFGGLVPYYVNWGDCVHPTNNIPIVGPLKSFTIRTPGGKVFDVLKDVENVTVESGEPSMELSIGTPKGTITFSSIKPEGITLPGK